MYDLPKNGQFCTKDNKYSQVFLILLLVLEIGILNVKSDGLYLSGMDSSHVSFIKIEVVKMILKLTIILRILV